MKKEKILTKLRIPPSQKVLKELLRYNKKTGDLFWKKRTIDWFADLENPTWQMRRWNSRYAGKKASCKLSVGGKGITIFHVGYLVHRIVWTIHYGTPPDKFIDHINGNPLDNRIKNLRNVTRAINNRNTKLNKKNKSGYPGVCFNKNNGKWSVYASSNGKQIKLGHFEEKLEAIAASKKLRKKLGHSERHLAGGAI